MTQDALQGVAPRDAPFFWLDPGVPLRTATATASGTVYVRERVWRVDGSRPSCVRTSRALQPAHPALGHNNLVFVDPSESSLVPVEFPACRMRHLPPSLPDSASTRAVTPFRELALGSRQTSVASQLLCIRSINIWQVLCPWPWARLQYLYDARCLRSRSMGGDTRACSDSVTAPGTVVAIIPNVADHGLNGQPVIWR